MIRIIAAGSAVVLTIGLVGFGIWITRLPPAATVETQVPPAAETQAMLEALAPRRADRPVIAVVGINDATETTDYIMPTGILRRADIADVLMLATEEGPVRLYPALTVEPDATIAAFDASHAEGADYVIVPAMSRDDDPRIMAWLQQQSDKGATIIAVCAGAKVVAAAGLLDGKRATTHWYYLRELLGRNPTIEYVADRRMVIDDKVATTTGISASMPMMLTLIEAIAGRQKAQATARELGVEHWDARHGSSAFTLTRPFATTVFANSLAFWRRDELGIELKDGIDEVSLAMVSDAWSRTYLSTAVTLAADTTVSANGIRIIPDRDMAGEPASGMVSVPQEHKPANTLDQSLAAIAERYGANTANVVAMQLEYPRPAQVQ